MLLLSIFVFAIIKKINIYKCFCDGISNALKLTISIFPYIAAIIIAISLFRISGLSNLFVNTISPLFIKLGIPKEVCELILLRPFTGSGSISIVENIITTYGANSYVAKCACCIMGSSETVFYVSAVYFSSIKLKGVAPAIAIALVGNFVASVLCCFLCHIF